MDSVSMHPTNDICLLPIDSSKYNTVPQGRADYLRDAPVLYRLTTFWDSLQIEESGHRGVTVIETRKDISESNSCSLKMAKGGNR